MDKFGKRVRKLREDKKLTREYLCDDETELSVRQLARIESGQSIPNLSKVSFIAKRLDVQISELTDEKIQELPQRYKELKYLILRLPTYENKERLQIRESYFDEIFEYYYASLDSKEKLVIDILESKYDIYISKNNNFIGDILDKYFNQTIIKDTFTDNDLILLDLYLSCLSNVEDFDELYNLENYDFVLGKLLNQNFTTADNYFILNNVLLNSLDLCFKYKRFQLVDNIIQKSEEIMSSIQDFQKRPILNMLEWKFNLFITKDKEHALKAYENSILFAKLIGDEHLVGKLESEWLQDSQHY
ncbi:MAG: helix-turn-helix domain-containing protein [Streptococcus sp.]|nr:helix-turn-helix domain-containing protein [Streptococcus sp.]